MGDEKRGKEIFFLYLGSRGPEVLKRGALQCPAPLTFKFDKWQLDYSTSQMSLFFIKRKDTHKYISWCQKHECF